MFDDNVFSDVYVDRDQAVQVMLRIAGSINKDNVSERLKVATIKDYVSGELDSYNKFILNRKDLVKRIADINVCIEQLDIIKKYVKKINTTLKSK